MAKVVKRGRVWYLRYTAFGKQHTESTHSSSKRFAERLLSLRLAEVAEGRQPLMIKSSVPRLKVWAETFLESVQGQNTRRRYKCSVRNLIRLLGERTRLSDIGPAQIEQFKRQRLGEAVGPRAPSGRRTLSPATANRDLAVLRRMLKLAARERLIARSPFADDGIECLEERKGRRRPRIITFAEEERILSACPPLLNVLVVLLIESGLRTGEALSLQWGDVDLPVEAIHIKEAKTPAGRRMVPMSTLCKKELLRWKDLTGPDFSPFLFPNPSNPAMHLKGVRKPWTAALKHAKLEYFRIYDLRANFASRLSASGVSDNLLAGVLGHSSPSIVRTYAKVVDQYRKDAIAKLEVFRQRQMELAAVSSEVPALTECPDLPANCAPLASGSDVPGTAPLKQRTGYPGNDDLLPGNRPPQ